MNKLLLFLLFSSCFVARSASQTFKTGDLFFAQPGGVIQWRDSNGVLIKNIVTGNTANGGIRHHPLTGELWVTNFSGPTAVRIIHTDGSLGNIISTAPYQVAAESIVFDKQGNAYVGGPYGECVKISADGSTILDHFPLTDSTTSNGPDWVELDCSDSIIYYTNERPRIHRYNIITHTRLSDLADFTGNTSWLFAMRVLHGDSMLVVSADNVVFKLAPNGSIVKTYTPTNPCGLFAIAGSADGKSFWVGGGASNAPVYKFDIASGVVQSYFTTGAAGINIHGFAVYKDGIKKCSSFMNNGNGGGDQCMHIYKNPNAGSFIIQTNVTGPGTILIFNILGQLIFRQAIPSTITNNKIPVTFWYQPAGVYFVELITKEEVCVKKIVVN